MSFWPLDRRRKAPEPPSRAPGDSVVKRLAVIELWTADEHLTVGMDLGNARLTDVLNGDPIVPVVLLDPALNDGSTSVDLRPDHSWHDMDVETVLLAFPPPHLTDPRRRLHRPRQLIDLRSGPFEVSGSVHIPPGAQAAGFLFRQSARFEPVTRASVRDSRSELFEQRAEVVLVNLHRVETMRDVGLGDSAAIESDEVPEAETPSE